MLQVEPGFIFVTHDKNGAWLALRETWTPGERLLGVAPFRRRLYQAKALTDATVDAAPAARAHRNSHGTGSAGPG